ncbi:MAG: YbgA family protein [Tissierellia bacterium]|nr:YbgA family protein [Tissierellia bacterium]
MKKEIYELEKLWAENKYLVLSRSQKNYKKIRELLKEKNNPNSTEIIKLIEDSKNLPKSVPNAINAAEHIWGYFKNLADENEKESFQKLIASFKKSEVSEKNIKQFLKRLLEKYPNSYLIKSNYFDID